MTRLKAIAQPVLLLALCALVSTCAHADEKIVQTITVDSPAMRSMIKQMSSEQRAKMAELGMGGTVQTTMFVSGKNARIDYGGTTVVYDGALQTATAIDRSTRRFTTRHYLIAPSSHKNIAFSVKDTGQKKAILGHLTRHYTFAMTSSDPNMGASVIKGDLWAAQDLALPPSAALGGGPAALLSGLTKVKGLPLKSTFSVSSGPTGRTTINTMVKSISTAPISSSVFSIPAGFTKAPEGAGVSVPGMMGGPPR